MIIYDKGEFPYPLDAMSMFVLQVAPVDVYGGHVKAAPFPPTIPLLLQGILILSRSLFLYVDTRVKTPNVPAHKKRGKLCAKKT